MSISDNIASVQDEIASACSRVGRNTDTVKLVAVSKTHPPEMILEAIDAGLTDFGENRVEESQKKVPQVNEQVANAPTWHFIGHIQSRKAADVTALFDVVHSVDRIKIARYLSDKGQEQDRHLSALIEINISGEDAKYGFNGYNWQIDQRVRDALWQNIRTMLDLPHLDIRGLMTMAPFYDKMETTRPIFAGLAELRDELQSSLGIALPELSMGMTNDYPVAIEEGATMIRVGRAIFGERQ
ncbi:MAG: YggS family pyridoxal phosphate-dependent enzyme [Anaerolineae bacterium]